VSGFRSGGSAQVPDRTRSICSGGEAAGQSERPPGGGRKRRDYQRVIDAYRRVYYTDPASAKAPESVVAVAELLAEMGRQFNDPKMLHAAIGQYNFLRHEYPGSRLRSDALFTIAQIYKDDLDDSAQAKSTFQDFLKQYPRNHLAEQAKQAVAELRHSRERDQNRAPDTERVRASDNKGLPRVTGIRHWSTPDYTRVAVDLETDVTFHAERLANPDRIVFDLHWTRLSPVLIGKTFDVEDGLLKKIRVAEYKADDARIVLEVENLSKYSAFLLPNPDRLIIDIHGRQGTSAALKNPPALSNSSTAQTPGGQRSRPNQMASRGALARPAGSVPKIISDDEETETSPAAGISKHAPFLPPSVKRPTRVVIREGGDEVEAREARPTASGNRSLIRALGLKIGKIVIDPGHGGHDTGTIGLHGLEEKDLVLDVALRLGKLLEQRLGADVVYTRDDDTFVPLETRTAIANQEQADLFISIHANSSHDPDARGVETYYLNFTTSRDALEVAARENAVSDQSIHQLQDLVKTIALKEKIEESREFAADVQHALYSGLVIRTPALHDRGVKKAPFVVLIGANMPSILAEISFVSNPQDERKLRTPAYRERIAQALYRGIAQYANGLSGIKVASAAQGDGQ